MSLLHSLSLNCKVPMVICHYTQLFAVKIDEKCGLHIVGAQGMFAEWGFCAPSLAFDPDLTHVRVCMCM